AVRPRVAVRRLLAEETEPRSLVEDDVVSLGVRRPVTVDAARLQRAVAHDLVQKGLRVVVELARCRLLEDPRELSFQLPGMEEELPVDVLTERRELRFDGPHAGEGCGWQLAERNALLVRTRILD